MSIHHHATPGRGERLAAALLRWALRAFLKPVFSPRVPIAWQRRWLRAMARLTRGPRGMLFTPARVGGIAGEWVRTAAAPTRSGALLYLHGGAYCIGSPATHRALTARLARRSGLPVFAADYRLAPEHRFPAAVDDALAAYRALRAEAPVWVAGDSAGGGLALALAIALRDAGEALPEALLLLSPWVDMSLADAPARPPKGEAMLSVPWARACAALVLGDAPTAHHWASPLHADLRGLPPVLVQAGTDELLHGQALALHDALQSAGVAVRCEITRGRWHVFQLQGGQLRSADEAIARLAAFTTAPSAAGAAAEHEVLILGAGMSGLCTALGLLRAGIADFVIVEQSAGVGGTWWDNRYPGAHVDVPAPLYSFSFAPNPGWRRRFAAAPEIQAYMQQLAERHGLLPHCRFGSRISAARFDEASGRWEVHTDSGACYSARFFVCSTGPLSRPRWPDIPGLDSFNGARLHSARWDDTVPLRGRRVAVIGTGSTASQLIAPIAEQAARLTVFQRTANWVLPRLDRRYGALDRLLARLPPWSAAVRWFWYGFNESVRRGFDDGSAMRRGMQAIAERQLRLQVVDEALRAKLRPPYALGCKRLIFSNDLYPALARPNVELVTEAITRITRGGVVTADGREHAADLLVCATGFDAQHSLAFPIQGRGGTALAEVWRDGPQARLGLTVAGFPNLFLMLGPNTTTAHTSTLLYIEPGVRWAIGAMQEVQRRGLHWLDLRPEVMQAFNDSLQARLAPSVWAGCRSWYRTEGGRITVLWPGFTGEYVRAVRRQRYGEFEFG